ncbi:MAG: UDP-N-acetylmuramate--L-alanine ligase [Bacteroidota bacterium]|nr:UDP-N-acetylmuramate--L-alanine ligase [Bacteroidota bacterium]
MDIRDFENIYFLGIGGIGMSAIARWFNQNEFKVGGYDKTETTLTKTLVKEGMDIHYDNQVGRIPTIFYNKSKTLIIITPAIPVDNSERLYFEKEGYVILKRSQVLGLLTKSMFTIAVAGTHGKTTTSSMIAHILHQAKLPINAFIGGIMTNYGTNLILAPSGPRNICVVEADEFDRSFLTLFPDIAVITSTDADHLDIYGTHVALLQSFTAFANQVKDEGKLFLKNGISLKINKVIHIQTYGYQNGSVHVDNFRLENANFIFDYVGDGISIKDLKLQIPGYHNSENATAAISVALALGVDPKVIKKALASFKGVKRRFEYIIKKDKRVYIDDYAHHPTEIEAFLTSVKGLYPKHKLVCIFQPHLYSRTKDFASEFANSLSLADHVILMDIYPAREKPMEGVTSDLIYKNLTCKTKTTATKGNLMQIVETLNPELIVTVGAGDIDTFVEPIKQYLNKKDKNK